jgi:hypothetical protein
MYDIKKDRDDLAGTEEECEFVMCMRGATIHERHGPAGVAFLFASPDDEGIMTSDAH